jgi:hypothetical protein
MIGWSRSISRENPGSAYLSPGYIHLIVNGREVFPDVSPRIIEGRVIVPI